MNINICQIESFLNTISGLIWGWPLIIFIIGTGVYFSLRLGLLSFSKLGLSLKYAVTESIHGGTGTGNISIFASLCTSLSATLGTGNIVGIAVAIVVGGPGSLFWLWVSSFFSLALKYAEGVLAIKYRKVEKNGNVSGGPMYYIRMGLNNAFLAKVFAFFGMMVALIGIGTIAQSNSIIVTLSSFGTSSIVTTIMLVIIVGMVTMGGLRRISTVAEKLVPLMTIFYIGAAILVLAANITRLPSILYSIVCSAFSPKSILGGGIGITATIAASVGASRGIFSHEAGLGSSAIAVAAAKTNSPGRQGLASMAGAFLSVVVCTMTGLVILIATDRSSPLEGAMLTSQAFSHGLGMPEVGKIIVGISIILFAFTTIIGWNYYGEQCVQFLFGHSAIVPYKILFIFFIAVGPFFRINAILSLADIVTGCMAIPNIIGLIGLRNAVLDETNIFFSNSKKQGG
ncbi:MAG: sodium:alanine symporter family protein [Puniceicoccales bacterium]|jgi:AGCS family alanine or glycine:cation symporter|nr:sodium:alanine symporter family protein [Puniceicoccales bacterium]